MTAAAIDADPELWHGLTPHADWGGAQVRDVGRVTSLVGNQPVIDGSDGQLVLAFKPGAPRSEGEAGKPYLLEGDDARRLRDLLNIATARGAL